MKPQTLKLTGIRCDSGTQCRSGINENAVAEYAERMLAGDSFPPVVVFFDGSQHHMADGFHRFMAASRNGAETILSDVRSGTATDALWHGLGSNRANGVRLSQGDKRCAVEIALYKFPNKSQQEIADHVGCSQKYVSQIKADVIPTTNVPLTRKDSAGRSQPTSKPRKPVVAEPQPDAAALPQHTQTRELRLTSRATAIFDQLDQFLSSIRPTRRDLLQLASMHHHRAKRMEIAAAKLES